MLIQVYNANTNLVIATIPVPCELIQKSKAILAATSDAGNHEDNCEDLYDHITSVASLDSTPFWWNLIQI